MPEENNNIQPEENKEVKTPETKPEVVLPPPPDPPTLTATVDPKQKAEQPKTQFSFSNPSATHQASAQPTKGDVKQQEETGLAALDKQIKIDEQVDGGNMSLEDYKDNAEMILDMYESGLTFIARLISKDTSDSAYEFPVSKKEKLQRQLVKVLRKRKVGLPIELMFAGTLLPATAQIIMKATDQRKKYMESKRKAEADGKISSESSTLKTKDNTEPIPKRRPGRPSK